MNVRVGPFYDSKEEDMVTVENLSSNRPRKPSVELLESVKLRPTYFSFPSSKTDLSPTLPSFRFPRYGYFGIQHEHEYGNSSPENVGSKSKFVPSPKSYFGDTPHRKTTIFGTIVNTINFFIGVGVLALPYSLRKSGWLGIVVLPIISYMMSRSAILLGRCQYRFSLDTYPDIAEVAFGRWGRSIVTVLFYLQLLFEVTIFQILLVQCLVLLLPQLSHSAITWLSTFVLILLANIFTSKGSASWLSLISCVSIVLLCILLLVAFTMRYVVLFKEQSQVTYYFRGSHEGASGVNDQVLTVMWGSLPNFCRFLAISCYCTMGHAVLPSIYRNMKRPSQFPTVVYFSFLIMVCIYTLIGAMGYAAYGEHADSNVLLSINKIGRENVRLARGQEVVASMVIVFILIAVSTKYALASVPITESLFDWTLTVVHAYYARVESDRKRALRGTPESSISNEYFQLSPSYADEEARSYHSMYMETQKRVIRSKIFESLDTADEFEEPEEEEKKVVIRSENLPEPDIDTPKLPTPFSVLIDQEIEEEEGAPVSHERPSAPAKKSVSYPKQPAQLQTEIAGAPSSLETLMICSPSEEDLGIDVNEGSVEVSAVTRTQKVFEGIFRIVVRTLLPFLSMWLATLFPHFVILIIFVGGVLGSLISILIPSACYLRMFGIELGVLEKLVIYLIILVALLIFGSTTGLLLNEHI